MEVLVTYKELMKLKNNIDKVQGVAGDLSECDFIAFVCEEKGLCIRGKFTITALNGMNEDVLSSEFILVDPLYESESPKKIVKL